MKKSYAPYIMTHACTYRNRDRKLELHTVTMLPPGNTIPVGVVIFHHGFTDHSGRHVPGLSYRFYYYLALQQHQAQERIQKLLWMQWLLLLRCLSTPLCSPCSSGEGWLCHPSVWCTWSWYEWSVISVDEVIHLGLQRSCSRPCWVYTLCQVRVILPSTLRNAKIVR